MGVFKKLLRLKPKIEEDSIKKEECWYNNAHESTESHLGEPLEGAGLSGANSFEYSVTKSNSMH